MTGAFNRSIKWNATGLSLVLESSSSPFFFFVNELKKVRKSADDIKLLSLQVPQN